MESDLHSPMLAVRSLRRDPAGSARAGLASGASRQSRPGWCGTTGLNDTLTDIARQAILLSFYIYLFLFRINGLQVVMLKTAGNSENIFSPVCVLSLYRRDLYFYVLPNPCQN